MADVLLTTLTGGGVIKSIQRGTAGQTGEVSISPVTASKASLSLLGCTYTGNSVSSAMLHSLTSSGFSVAFSSGGAPGFSVSWQVVEYY